MAKIHERSLQDRFGDSGLEHAPVSLAGRTADEVTIVRWVANNIDAAEPDPSTCPSPFAWTLLRECRETPGFIPDSFLPLWVKLIPAKSQLEAGGVTKVLDGKAVIDLIDRVAEHSRAAQGHRKKTEPQPEEET